MRRILRTFSIFLVLAVPIILFINYRNSTAKVTVEYENVQDVRIVENHGEHESHEEDDKTVTSSGQNIKLKKNQSYRLIYKGVGDYASGEQDFTTNTKNQTHTIKPRYSEAKLNSLLDQEIVAIHQKINNRYKAISLYQIQRGELYHFGDWYGTTLKYVGSDPFNSDTLRVVMQKENNAWFIKTDPPNIILSKVSYPKIPEDILRDVNLQ